MQMRLGIISISRRRYSTKCLKRFDHFYIEPAIHVLRRKFANNVESATPVNLAFASYESTKDDQQKLAPILIMHGLFGSKNNWNSLSKAIHQNTNRKVIAIDARNHGDSPHTEEMTYHHMANDLVHLLQSLTIDKAILIGHSMGGGCVMHTALNYPEIVEKLVVVDFSPVKVSPSLMSMSTVFQAMTSINLEGIASLSKARKTANEQMARIIDSEILRQFLLMNLVESESGEYKWRVNVPVLEAVFRTKIATFPNNQGKVYEKATLFLGGAKSDYLKPEDHDRIKVFFPNARFHYVAGAGHWLHADKPAEFISQVTTFINEPH